MATPTTEQCGNCFYVRIRAVNVLSDHPTQVKTTDQPECHFDPPMQNHWWPQVEATDWCGKFKSTQGPQERIGDYHGIHTD